MDIKHCKVIFFALAFVLSPYTFAQHPGEPDSETGFMGKGRMTSEGNMTLQPTAGKQPKHSTYGEGRGDANRQQANERFTKAPKLKQKKQ